MWAVLGHLESAYANVASCSNSVMNIVITSYY